MSTRAASDPVASATNAPGCCNSCLNSLANRQGVGGLSKFEVEFMMVDEFVSCKVCEGLGEKDTILC